MLFNSIIKSGINSSKIMITKAKDLTNTPILKDRIYKTQDNSLTIMLSVNKNNRHLI